MNQNENIVANDVLIRFASTEDAEILAYLSYRTFAETFAHLNSEENMREYLSSNCTAEVLAEELQDPASTFLIVATDDEAVGFAKLRRSYIPVELKDQRAVEIHRLYVLQKMIGKKLGKLLMEKCCEIAKQENFDTIWLGVWEHNERAISFYKKFGFEVFGSQIFVVGRDRQNDLMMKKIL
jgi:diamine N-acetyltransferase